MASAKIIKGKLIEALQEEADAIQSQIDALLKQKGKIEAKIEILNEKI